MKRFFLGLLIVFSFFIIGIITFLIIQIQQLKPTYTSQIHSAKVSAPVTISRDSSGVIHIRGQNMEDVILASGYAAAQDRLWQMSFLRWLAKGKLSKIFGQEALKMDKLLLTLRINDLTNRLFEQLSERSRKWLSRYAEGINLYLQEKKDDLPLEFILLKIKPDPWTPQDCLLQNRMMAWLLNFSWKADVLYWYLSSLLPKSLFREIMPNWGDYPEIIPLDDALALIKEVLDIDHKIQTLAGFPTGSWGSNGWVIAPQLSENGKAMLANDPHLPLQLPSIWLEMHLQTPEINVAGFSLPGTPGIIIGRNENIAWGMTNGMIDDSDYFIEKVDTSRKIYWIDGNEKNLKIFNYIIEVKNHPPVYYNVYWTEKGPLLNSIFANLKLNNFISLKWVGWEDSDELLSFIHLAKAKNWQDFKNALRFFTIPCQNFMYADREGNIGYRLAGKIPLRTYKEGLIPKPGYISKNIWNGWISFENMPELFNPQRGYIVTANNKILEDQKFYLSEFWEPPYRALRIEQLIASKTKHSVTDMKKYQSDKVNLLAKEVLPIILSELNKKAERSKIEEDILLILKKWNYISNVESIASLVFETMQNFLVKNIFIDEMGKEAFELFTDLPNFYLRIYVQIMKNKYSGWFDNRTTKIHEDRGNIVEKSFQQTLTYLNERLGPDIEQWYWGKLHRLELQHILGQIGLTRKIFNRGPYPIGGSCTTVNVASYKFDNPFDVIIGPSMRFIVDWHEQNVYFSILPGGNSGKRFSPFYDNQIRDWRIGNLKKVSIVDYKKRNTIAIMPVK